MLRLDPTSDGGFLVYNDYMADIGTSAFGIVVFVIYFLAILNPFFNNPSAFYDSFTALFIAIIILFFIGTIEGLEFLSPLALPFLTYALASTGVSMCENVTPSIGILMIAAIPIIMLLMNVAIVFLISPFSFGYGIWMVIAIMNFIVMTYCSFAGSDSNGLFYLQRVMTIVAIVTTLFRLYMHFSNKIKINSESIIANLLLIGVGLISFIALSYVVLLFRYRAFGDIVIVALTIATFIAITYASYKFIRSHYPKLKGDFSALLFGAFFSIVCLFSFNTFNTLRDGFVAPIIRYVSFLPFARSLALGADAVINAFANTLGSIVTMLFNLILLIFDTKLSSNFVLPFPVALIFMLIILSLTVALTVIILKKHFKTE